VGAEKVILGTGASFVQVILGILVIAQPDTVIVPLSMKQLFPPKCATTGSKEIVYVGAVV